MLFRLLTWLSTRMQSLEHSLKGTTKLGQVKTGQGDYLKCIIPDSLSYLLSGCLTHFQWFLGHWEASWTTAHMSPQHYMLPYPVGMGLPKLPFCPEVGGSAPAQNQLWSLVSWNWTQHPCGLGWGNGVPRTVLSMLLHTLKTYMQADLASWCDLSLAL